jgi:hypothetical protein
MRTGLAGLIALLLFSTSLPADATAATWTGTWNTNYGRVVLTQTGASVTGTYLFCSGHISGSVTGATMHGSWHQRFPCGGAKGGSGRLEFTLSASGESFKGRWKYAFQKAWFLPWNGMRRGVVAHCPPAGVSVHYAVTQRGTPLAPGAPAARTTTTGAGTLRGGSLLALGCTTRLLHVHPGRTASPRDDVRIALATTGGAAAVLGHGARRLVLEVVVESTNSPNCPLGTTGRVVLTDRPHTTNPRDVEDELRTELCDHLHTYRSTPANGLAVRVTF